MKRFRDAVVDEPRLKNNPELEDLRKRLLREPLTFFRSLREQLEADRDTRPEALARLASAAFELGALTSEIGNLEDAAPCPTGSAGDPREAARDNPSVATFQRDLASSRVSIGSLQRETGKRPEAVWPPTSRRGRFSRGCCARAQQMLSSRATWPTS